MMNDLREWAAAVLSAKVLTVAAFAAIGAMLPSDMTPRQRAMTFFVGFVAALVFGEPLRELLGLSETWAYGMAGVIALTGRNIAAFLIRASRDPVAAAEAIMAVWRGKK